VTRQGGPVLYGPRRVVVAVFKTRLPAHLRHHKTLVSPSILNDACLLMTNPEKSPLIL
jgi:hypothetical protein